MRSGPACGRRPACPAPLSSCSACARVLQETLASCAAAVPCYPVEARAGDSTTCRSPSTNCVKDDCRRWLYCRNAEVRQHDPAVNCLLVHPSQNALYECWTRIQLLTENFYRISASATTCSVTISVHKNRRPLICLCGFSVSILQPNIITRITLCQYLYPYTFVCLKN